MEYYQFPRGSLWEQSQLYFPLVLVTTTLNFVLVITLLFLWFYHLQMYSKFSLVLTASKLSVNRILLCSSITCFIHVIFFSFFLFLDLSMMTHRCAVYFFSCCVLFYCLNILQFVYILFCRLYCSWMVSTLGY